MVQSPAHARQYNALTEDRVEDFVQTATDMTSGKTDADIDKIERYLDKHIHKKARFKSTVQYLLPGYPPQETALALDKDDYISSIKEGVHTLQDHTSDIEITSINITSDKQQAMIQTEGHETGMMAVPVPGGAEEHVPIEGYTQCNQIIRLSKDGVIQMYNAVCDTRIEFINNDFDPDF